MSVQTSTYEVLTAMYGTLTLDGTLMGMITGVFDFGAVPTNQAFPYVTIGEFDEKPDNAFGQRGYLTAHKLHIWDSKGLSGFQLSQQILARLNTLLDQQPMTLATHTFVYCLYQQAIPMNDPGEDKILHTSVEYEVFTQEPIHT